MRVIQGERPSRPSPGNGCSLEPTDEAWDLISRCWAHESDARPRMAEVCSLLAGAPASTGTPGPAFEPITCASVIYNVARASVDIMTVPAATASTLAQPVLRLVPTFVQDVPDRTMTRPTSDQSDPVVHQVKARYACGCLSLHAGTVAVADGVQTRRPPRTPDPTTSAS
jgi:hypothetical protein